LRRGGDTMTTIVLTDHQAATLLEYLQSALGELSVEIAGTDRKSYRDEIKAERSVLSEVLHKLEAADVSPA
jgi:hypothetical protein